MTHFRGVRHPLLAAAIFAFYCSVPSSAQRPPLFPSSTERISRIRAAYSASISRLNRTCYWQFCRAPELRTVWTLLGEWLSAYLDDHRCREGQKTALLEGCSRLRATLWRHCFAAANGDW